MATTDTNHFPGMDRYIWQTVARNLLPANAGYFWAQLRDRAIAKIGPVIHRGDHWSRLVDDLAEAMLDDLGVEWEMHAGYRYIAGKRVYWDGRAGRYTQDDWR